MSDVECRQCGQETNEPPDEAPIEWIGLCPACAVGGALEGDLPGAKLASDLLMRALFNAIKSGRVMAIPVADGPGEHVITPAGPVFYSQN